MSTDIKLRVRASLRKCKRFKGVLCVRKIPVKLKRKVHKTLALRLGKKERTGSLDRSN